MFGRKKNEEREPYLVHIVAAHDGNEPRYVSESTNQFVSEVDAGFHAMENPNVPFTVESYIDYPVEWLKNNPPK
jgi:hypothetical protein